MINNIINLTMDSGISVKVDRNNICASPYELQEYFNELFVVKKKYNKDERINLSSYCDCMFNLMFCGINKENKEMSFRLC